MSEKSFIMRAGIRDVKIPATSAKLFFYGVMFLLEDIFSVFWLSLRHRSQIFPISVSVAAPLNNHRTLYRQEYHREEQQQREQ